MPRSRSTAIQSERTRRRSPRALTSPASWIAPPNSSNFSVKVVLPASGCEMIAKVRRRAISWAGVGMKGTTEHVPPHRGSPELAEWKTGLKGGPDYCVFAGFTPPFYEEVPQDYRYHRRHPGVD